MSRYSSQTKAIQCLTATCAIIASHVTSPKDLLNLSRTCKAMFICFPKWSCVWKKVLEQCGGEIPPCPAGRQPRTWTILQYTNECMTCGVDTANLLFGHPASRFCDECIGSQLVISPVQPSVYTGNTFWVDGVPKQRREMIFWRDVPLVVKSAPETQLNMHQEIHWFPATYYPQQHYNHNKLNTYGGLSRIVDVAGLEHGPTFASAMASVQADLTSSAESMIFLSCIPPFQYPYTWYINYCASRQAPRYANGLVER
ncbi:hypothetical protein FRC08_001179 [Ceratobasidium sp. 394]|nr:hypothetical protein FRC08_001179 [Ceratobasidium sp. 394]